MTPRTVEVDTALAKLARSLEVDPADVEFLAHVDVTSLRDLRWHVEDRLAAVDAKRLRGVVAASNLLPAGLAASIGERWFGPVLCARLVGLIEPRRGGQFARHLSVDFMADITARTDPRVVGGLVHELDTDIMRRIAIALVDRDDHLTLSHFVGHIPPAVVADVLEAIADNAAVVRIARFVEDLDHLDPVVARLPDERIVGLVRAVDAEDLWVDGFHLFTHLGDEQITRVAATIVRQDADAVRAALEAFERHDLWESGLALVDHLDERDLASFADVLLSVDDDLVFSAVDVVDRIDAWDTLVRVALAADDLGDDVRARLSQIVDGLPAARVAAFEKAARTRGHPDLLDRVLGGGT